MSRLYATLALLAMIGLAWWQYSSAITDRDKYKADSIRLEAELQVEKDIVKAKELAITEANKRAVRYSEEKKVIENEAKSNRECIAAGTCGVVLRFKSAVCTELHNTTTSRSGTNESSGTDPKDFARWYDTLEEAIKKNELKIVKLQEELSLRSKPNYCTAVQHKF